MELVAIPWMLGTAGFTLLGHKSEGNGLGLALVKQIVKHEGGTVSVSDAEIGGAKFTVKLQNLTPAKT